MRILISTEAAAKELKMLCGSAALIFSVKIRLLARNYEHPFMRHRRAECLATLIKEHHINIAKLSPLVLAFDVGEEPTKIIDRLDDVTVIDEPVFHRLVPCVAVAVARFDAHSSCRFKMRDQIEQRMSLVPLVEDKFNVSGFGSQRMHPGGLCFIRVGFTVHNIFPALQLLPLSFGLYLND